MPKRRKGPDDAQVTISYRFLRSRGKNFSLKDVKKEASEHYNEVFANSGKFDHRFLNHTTAPSQWRLVHADDTMIELSYTTDFL